MNGFFKLVKESNLKRAWLSHSKVVRFVVVDDGFNAQRLFIFPCQGGIECGDVSIHTRIRFAGMEADMLAGREPVLGHLGHDRVHAGANRTTVHVKEIPLRERQSLGIIGTHGQLQINVQAILLHTAVINKLSQVIDNPHLCLARRGEFDQSGLVL